MNYLLQEYIMKAQKELNFGESKHHSLNIILVKYYVPCYKKCWKHRNRAYHNRDKERKRARR